MRNIKLLFLILLTVSCSSDDDGSSTPPDGGGGGSQTNLPSNLVVILDIQGQTSENPDGDGSGIFNLTATADNAVSYGFKVDSADEVENTSGNFYLYFRSKRQWEIELNKSDFSPDFI